MSGATAVEANLRPMESALLRPMESTWRSVDAALRTVEATLRPVIWRSASGAATRDLRMRYRSIRHAHATHRLASRHVLVVCCKRFEAWLTVYRTARLLYRRDRRLAVIKRHEV